MNPPPARRRTAIGITAAVLAIVSLLLTVCGSSAGSSSGGETAGGSTPPGTSGDGGTKSTEAAQEGGTLTFALSTDPIAIQPRGGGAGNDQLYVARQLFDSLLEQDPKTGEIIPWLAESFDVNADATEFTFHLQDGVTFSDGTPLTAEVVKANFDDIVASGAKATWVTSFFVGFKEATVVDPSTVKVVFTTPNAAFPQAATTSALGIVGPATLAVPFEERATANLVGTGPFVLDHYTKNSEIVLNKRPGYAWAPADRTNTGDAHLDSIVFKIVPEASVRTGSLQSGEVDAIGGVPPQDIEPIRDGGFAIVSRANPGLTFGINVVQNHPPLEDERVRQALAAGIDTTDVRDTVLSPEFAVAQSALSQTTPGFVAVDELIEYDPDAAGKLLDEAGWTAGPDGVRQKDGKPLHLILGWLTNFGPNQGALELIQAQLGEIGVEIELKSSTGPEFQTALADGAFDLVWSNLSRADGDVLRTAFSTAGPNYYKTDDPELQTLLTEQIATPDPEDRDAVLADIQSRLAAEAHQIPVFELTTVLALDETVHNVTLGADSRLDQLTDAWVAS